MNRRINNISDRLPLDLSAHAAPRTLTNDGSRKLQTSLTRLAPVDKSLSDSDVAEAGIGLC